MSTTRKLPGIRGPPLKPVVRKHSLETPQLPRAKRGSFSSAFPPAESRRDALVATVQSLPTVQPGTGLVFKYGNSTAEQHPLTHTLEWSYCFYDQVCDKTRGLYVWDAVDALLKSISSRNHQAILRFAAVIPGSGVNRMPAWIQALPSWQPLVENSTNFCDWRVPELAEFVLEFLKLFCLRYSGDNRIYCIQMGFGCWSEWNSYPSSPVIGNNFPPYSVQASVLNLLASSWPSGRWQIGINAGSSAYSVIATTPQLLNLPYGMFSDSEFSATYYVYNSELMKIMNWWTVKAKEASLGGEIAYTGNVQQDALNPTGPDGISPEQMIARDQLTWLLGDGQFAYQTPARIQEVSAAFGYSFEYTQTSSTTATITNTGVAPPLVNVYVWVSGEATNLNLKGLQPKSVVVVEGTLGIGDVELKSDQILSTQAITFVNA